VPSDNPATARPAAVAALVAFPVVLAAADLAAPSFAHGRDLAVAVAGHPARTWLLVGLRLADAVLLLAAAAVIWLATRHVARGRTLGAVSVVLAILGALGQAQDAAYQLFVLSLRDHPADQAGAILTRLDALAAPLELPLLLAFALALPLLLLAAHRAGSAPIWAVVAAALAFVLHFAPGPVPSRGADLLLIAAFIGVAITTGSSPRRTGHPDGPGLPTPEHHLTQSP
jgi:hypothetical protein